jgi:glucose-1-phosphate cytidylyltransferase
MQVGEAPVLRHVMEIYARQGFCDFVLAAGYRADLIAEFAQTVPADWRAQVVDTGEDTGTGGRIHACAEVLGASFMVTYGDGLGSVDLGALLAFHQGHAGSATVTGVPLPSPYGTMEWDESGRVHRFVEKPRLSDHWINAGFLAFEQRAFEHWSGDDLEREVLPAMASAGELFMYRHTGFWRSMDTYKDALELSELCREGEEPWTKDLPASGCSSPAQRASSAPT